MSAGPADTPRGVSLPRVLLAGAGLLLLAVAAFRPHRLS